MAPAAALCWSAWLLTALGWTVASGAALRYAQTEANSISTLWVTVGLASAAVAVLVDLVTRRARGTGAGAVVARTAGSTVAGASLGFAIADAVMVSRGYAEPKGYVLVLFALLPLAIGVLLFFLPTMRERSRRQRADQSTH